MSSQYSFLLAKISSSNGVIKQHKAENIGEAASLIKVFYALEVLRRLEQGLIKKKSIKIKPEMVSKYGTNVLGGLLDQNSSLTLSVQSLVGLMIKYSCNSSTDILRKYLLPDSKSLQKIARDIWGLNSLKLIENGKDVKRASVTDIYKLFQAIFSSKPALKKYNNFLQEKLKTSRNIYYLFDQLEVNVLGSKSGTLQKDGYYFINDSGVIEIGKQKYFIVAMVKDKKISSAVLQIRKIGRRLLKDLK